MKQILLVAFIGYVLAAKLDHLEYLPPHHRPVPTHGGNQDSGLEAPRVETNLKSAPAVHSFSQYTAPQPSHQQFAGQSQPQQPSKQGFFHPQAPSSQPSAFGQQPNAFSAPASQKYTASSLPAPVNHVEPQIKSSSLNSFAHPQPSHSFNQKTAFGGVVESNDDTISIDVPVVGNDQNSFGLPNPSRQYLTPFKNNINNEPTSGSYQQKPSTFGNFNNGPAKFESIFNSQKPTQPSPNQQYQSPIDSNNQPAFSGPAKVISEFGNQGPSSSQKYLAPTPQNNFQENQQSNGIPQFHNINAFGSHQRQSQPSEALRSAPQPQSKYQAPSQQSHGAPQANNQPTGGFGSYQGPSQSSGAPHTVPQQGPLSYKQPAFSSHSNEHTFQPFKKSSSPSRSTQNSAPYQYNKPTPSFSTPSFGKNNVPQGSLPQNQGSSFFHNNLNAPNNGFNVQQSQNSPSTSPGFGLQDANGHNKQNSGSRKQYPVQLQDEKGGYVY